ncbi:MAG: hypothetical protein CFE44_14645 [Burkholderiales bacterium PBB4]|nr:MAG: hypothetical protein CFE44_14645 [Burkholderiales bacterium PBB4]
MPRVCNLHCTDLNTQETSMIPTHQNLGLRTTLRHWVIACTVAWAGVSPAVGGAEAVATDATSLTAQQVQEDVQVLLDALKTLHPALTKYRSAAEMETAFSRFEARGRAARNAGELYLAATEVAAAIRCGHTWTNWRNQQGAARATLLDQQDKLPVTLSLVEGRWVVLASADPAVRPGEEVVSINGMTTPAHIARLMPYLRADGSSDGKRLRQLSHDRPDLSQVDLLLPLLSSPVGGRYRLTLRTSQGVSRTVLVEALTLQDRTKALLAQGVQPPSEAWTFAIREGVGYLVLRTFSFWNDKFDWASFLDEAFSRLQAEQIRHLVIDLRANEGGNAAIGNQLLSHLIRQPLGYLPSQSVTNYERVPDRLRKVLDTWDSSFFDRTGDVEPIASGTARGKFQVKSRPMVPRFISPAATPFAGHTLVLVGAENSSATFVLADLLKRSGVATLIGQATGGNQRGLNGGQLAWVRLPHSGVAVDIPLLAAHYDASTPDTSVPPDIAVTPRFAARVAGVDQEMEAAKTLIAARKSLVAQ